MLIVVAIAGLLIAVGAFTVGLFDGAAAGAQMVARRWLELHPEDGDVVLDPQRRRGRRSRPASIRHLAD